MTSLSLSMSKTLRVGLSSQVMRRQAVGRPTASIHIRTFSSRESVPTYRQQYINGEWIESTNKESLIDVIDSNTGEVCARVADGSATDTERAIDAAAAAFPAWSRLSLGERKSYVEAIITNYQKVHSDVVSILRKELGAPKLHAEDQADLFTAHLGGAMMAADEIEWKRKVQNPGGSTTTTVVREAVGVAGCITPWNWPLNQIAAKCGPALVAGCTVVLKPSEVTPVNAYLLTEAIHAAGLPRGVFNLVVGKGAGCGEVLATHPKVDMVSFTGSTPVGRKLHSLGSSTVKRVRTELGGKSSLIVLDDAPEDKIFPMASSVILNGGQTCDALSRMLVPRSRYERILEVMKAEFEKIAIVDSRVDTDGSLDMGPLASQQQYQKVRSYIAKGVEEGATLVTGGLEHPQGCPESGFFVKPTLFANVNMSMTIAEEEIFGPVLCMIPYDTEEEAVAMANDTVYGLSNGVVSADSDRALQVALQLRSGQVNVNALNDNIMAPFGGYKQSGDGREGGVHGLEDYLQVKALISS